MTTVLDIITDALQDAGILAENETPSATMGQKAFRLLNRMLDADSTENLMIFDNVSEVFALTNKQTYTIGSGGDFNTTRPVNITAAYMRDSSGNDLGIEILDYTAYADIISKPITGTIATAMYYDATFPLSKLSFWPVPSATTYSVVLWSWKTLTSFATLSDIVSLPPGYEDYIESNLAQRCCVAFNRALPQELSIWASDSKAKLKRINMEVPVLGFPTSLVGGRLSSTFPISPSILTGY